MPAHTHAPSAFLTLFLSADLALHAIAIGLCDHLLVSNTSSSQAFSLAVSSYTRSLQAIGRNLIVLSMCIQAALFSFPVSLAWARFAGTKTAMALIQFDKAVANIKTGIGQGRIWRSVVSWCVEEVGDGVPARPWMWDGKMVGWWIGSLIVKLLIMGIATFFTCLNYFSIVSATAAALYTSDPNLPNNPYDQLVGVTSVHLGLCITHLLILVWTCFQMCSACYGIRGGGFSALGITST
ncbi:hypothetical protein BCR44DRAFT_50580 [Catenaria anguillulae PL171]|uniref:Uncharacterized protein n=1 Tax=Catenaria anguillulae PL171 TaxID=765915 RepID=A0A1Y2HCA7_9FUNG|nr:hypothetical protein BCR44DRAFT_50580 [Catenaria anguillulae PL171]